jgi:hypothetical protein
MLPERVRAITQIGRRNQDLGAHPRDADAYEGRDRERERGVVA